MRFDFFLGGRGPQAPVEQHWGQADSGFYDDHLHVAQSDAKRRKLDALSRSVDGAACDYLRQMAWIQKDETGVTGIEGTGQSQWPPTKNTSNQCREDCQGMTVF